MANQVITKQYEGQSIQVAAGSAITQIISLVGTDNFRQSSSMGQTVWEVNTTANGWTVVLTGDYVILDGSDNIYAMGPDQYALAWETLPADG